MSVTGLMIYYDEPLEALASAVTSFAPALDHLVAVDGAYDYFPGGISQPVSPVEQARIILEVAAAAKLDLTLHRPTSSYAGNEVEKRQQSLDIARATYGLTEDDWVVVFDADNVATRITFDFKDILAADDTYACADYALISEQYGGGYTLCRGIYRMLEGLSYGPAHWSVSAPQGIDSRIWLWGPPGPTSESQAQGLDVSDYLRVTHRVKSPKRREAADSYYRIRDDFNLEQVSTVTMNGLDGELVTLDVHR